MVSPVDRSCRGGTVDAPVVESGVALDITLSALPHDWQEPAVARSQGQVDRLDADFVDEDVDGAQVVTALIGGIWAIGEGSDVIIERLRRPAPSP